MSANISFQIETEQTIFNTPQIKSNERRNKRKNSSDLIQKTNKKQKMSSINFEKFEELNKEYEALFEKVMQLESQSAS